MAAEEMEGATATAAARAAAEVAPMVAYAGNIVVTRTGSDTRSCLLDKWFGKTHSLDTLDNFRR